MAWPTLSEQCNEFDHLTVGSTLRWANGREATVVRMTGWAPKNDPFGSNFFRAGEREQYVVVARPVTETEDGIPISGGYELLQLKRWTFTPNSIRGERGHGNESEELDYETLATSGVRYQGTVDTFLQAFDRHNRAWAALDQAIAETDPDNPDRDWR